jgi:hypothetical protein
MEQIEYFEKSAYKSQTPGNHPKEILHHPEQNESLKSSIILVVCCNKKKLSTEV